MKIEEAKTKICPFIQSTSATNDADCYDYQTHKNIYCHTSDCMAWAKTVQYDSMGIAEIIANDGYCKRIGQ